MPSGREAEIEVGEVKRDQVIERGRLDAVQLVRDARMARKDRAADRLRLHGAHIDPGQAPGGVPMAEHQPARSRAAQDFDAELLGRHRPIGVGVADRRWGRGAGRVARGPGRGAGRGAFEKGVAEQMVAHEADDLLAAPDVVTQELRDLLQLGAMAGHRIAQIEARVAQRRVGQR